MPAPTGEQKPLVVAQQRASAAVINETREAAQHRFLRGVFDGRTTAWPRADVARVTRDRHTAVEDAVAKAHILGWNKSGGGFRIPLGALSIYYHCNSPQSFFRL